MKRIKVVKDRKVKLRLNFDPIKHPRDPETGKFVERPYPVPDDISGLDTEQLIGELAAANENFAEQVEGIAVDMPGDNGGIPTEIQDIIDNPDAGSGASFGDIEPIEDPNSLEEGDYYRENGDLRQIVSKGGQFWTVEKVDTGTERTVTPDELSRREITTPGPVAEGRTTVGEGERIEISNVEETEYGWKAKIDAPIDARGDIKDLGFDETHRSWNSETETWDIDLDAVGQSVDQLSENWSVRVDNDILEAAGARNQIDS